MSTLQEVDAALKALMESASRADKAYEQVTSLLRGADALMEIHTPLVPIMIRDGSREIGFSKVNNRWRLVVSEGGKVRPAMEVPFGVRIAIVPRLKELFTLAAKVFLAEEAEVKAQMKGIL